MRLQSVLAPLAGILLLLMVLLVRRMVQITTDNIQPELLDIPEQLRITQLKTKEVKVTEFHHNEEDLNDISGPLPSDACFRLNSPAWLKGRRIGNIRELPDSMVNELILAPPLLSDALDHLLGHTICHANGRFRDFRTRHDDRDVQYWALRFFYLGLHVHQHHAAKQEAQHRRDNHCTETLLHANVGNFDFECPNEAFLVVHLTRDAGLGAHMRLGALNALVAGVVTNRTTLLIHHKDKPWSHASCERGDIQCFYMPPTPCVITEQQLAEAHELTHGETRQVFRKGVLPLDHANDRVLIMTMNLVPKPFPDDAFRTTMMRYAETMINELNTTDTDRITVQLMQQSLEQMLHIEPSIPERPYQYIGAISKPHHAAIFYAMRPSPYNVQRLKKISDLVIPKDLDPSQTFGLPIRASDKCYVESECLPFDTLMNVMKQVWEKHSTVHVAKNINIVLTTESNSVLEDMAAYQSAVPFEYTFVYNNMDVLPDSGLPTEYKNISKEDVMLSMVSSIQMQLHAGYSIGNCCSNFHLLLFDFLRDGCGAATNSWNQCLQENENPDFLVCCQWTTTENCKAKKAKMEYLKLETLNLA